HPVAHHAGLNSSSEPGSHPAALFTANHGCASDSDMAGKICGAQRYCLLADEAAAFCAALGAVWGLLGACLVAAPFAGPLLCTTAFGLPLFFLATGRRRVPHSKEMTACRIVIAPL